MIWHCAVVMMTAAMWVNCSFRLLPAYMEANNEASPISDRKSCSEWVIAQLFITDLGGLRYACE
jgi:hypothetical protein